MACRSSATDNGDDIAAVLSCAAMVGAALQQRRVVAWATASPLQCHGMTLEGPGAVPLTHATTFVELRHHLRLLAEASVAIDGRTFKAVK